MSETTIDIHQHIKDEPEIVGVEDERGASEAPLLISEEQQNWRISTAQESMRVYSNSIAEFQKDDQVGGKIELDQTQKNFIFGFFNTRGELAHPGLVTFLEGSVREFTQAVMGVDEIKKPMFLETSHQEFMQSFDTVGSHLLFTAKRNTTEYSEMTKLVENHDGSNRNGDHSVLIPRNRITAFRSYVSKSSEFDYSPILEIRVKDNDEPEHSYDETGKISDINLGTWYKIPLNETDLSLHSIE